MVEIAGTDRQAVTEKGSHVGSSSRAVPSRIKPEPVRSPSFLAADEHVSLLFGHGHERRRLIATLVPARASERIARNTHRA